MEREDNYLQNSQNLMENLQMPCGGGGVGVGDGSDVGVGVGAEIVAGLGGKFEEHGDEHDEEEWKYIKEVQQSEKLQMQTKADDTEEGFVRVAAAATEMQGIGNGVAGGADAEQHQLNFGVGNNGSGDGEMNAAIEAAIASKICGTGTTGGSDEEELQIIKNDGDFSTTSNTTSTPGEDTESDLLLQVAMQQQQLPQENMEPQTVSGKSVEEMDDDEPSSLTTNTTNGTSSLSENAPQQQQQPQVFGLPMDDLAFDNKENANPFDAGDGVAVAEAELRPATLDIEPSSFLNPDAKEFVPSFASNPTTPTSPIAEPFEQLMAKRVGEPAATHPNALPRHVFGGEDDNDFVAQSPVKGRALDMDSITVPGAAEFEAEVAKRPHELEQPDDLIGGGGAVECVISAINTAGDNSIAAFEEHAAGDEQRESPVSLIDHGPETSVDLDVDIQEQQSPAIDVIKPSMYGSDGIASPIEDVLNSVQPLPSYIEEDVQNDKELLNVEEKERISQSPSMEAMEVQFSNEMNAAKMNDFAQEIPATFDDEAKMQESVYVERTSSSFEQQQQQEQRAFPDGDNSLLADTSCILLDAMPSFSDNSFNQALPDNGFEFIAATSPQHDLLNTPDLVQESKLAEDVKAPSPFPTDEQHLIEETKEQSMDDMNELEQNMVNLLLADDGNLPQVEQVVEVTTTIAENLNPFIQEAEQQTPMATMPDEPEQSDLQQQIQQPEQQQEVLQFEQIIPSQLRLNDQLLAPQQQQEQHEQQTPEEAAVIFSTLTAEEEALKTKLESEISAIAEAAAPPAEAEAETVAVAETAGAEADAEKQVAADAAAAAVAATLATAAVVGVTAAAKKTSEAAKTGPAAGKIAAKPKAGGDAKKLAEAKKSTTATTTGAAKRADATKAVAATTRPRTAPAKPASTAAATAAKKPTTGAATAATKPTTTTTARKTLSAATTGATAGKLSAKPSTTSTGRPASAAVSKTSVTSKTSTTSAAARPSTATAAGSKTRVTAAAAPRKPAAASVAPATNGTVTARPARPATAGGASTTGAGPTGAAPIKPTTLGLSAAAKPKQISPRATLTTQLRKAAPAKSPTKPAPVAASNGVAAKSSTVSVSSTRTKTTGTSAAVSSTNVTTTTTTTTTTTKTFTARPAPKFTATNVASNATAARRVSGKSPTAAAKPSSANGSSGGGGGMLRKVSPSKPTSAGAAKLSSNKLAAATTKAKEASKTPSPRKPITKPATPAAAAQKQQPKTNGAADAAAGDAVEALAPPQLQLNGDSAAHTNGVHDTINPIEPDLLINEAQPASAPTAAAEAVEVALIDV